MKRVTVWWLSWDIRSTSKLASVAVVAVRTYLISVSMALPKQMDVPLDIPPTQHSGVPRLLCALCSVQQTAFSNEQPLLTEENAINVDSWELSCSQAAEHRQVVVSGFRKAHKIPWCWLQSIEIKTANLFESSEFKLRRRYHIFNGTEGPKREEISEQKLLALKTTTLSTYILFLGFTFKTSSDLASRVSDSSK